MAENKEQENCIICGANLKIVGIGGHVKGGWECNRCAKGMPLGTIQIKSWDRRYGKAEKVIINEEKKERNDLEVQQMIDRMEEPVQQKRTKKAIDYVGAWYSDTELRRLFETGHDFIVFCKTWDYGSCLPGVMRKHLDVLKQHRKRQIVEAGK